MTIKHAFESQKSDGADASLVRPSNWNADHVIDDAPAARAALGIAEPSYGGCYEDNETGSAIALTSNAALYKWMTSGAGTVKGAPYVTFDNGSENKHLVIGTSGAGLYLLNFHFSGSLGAANELRCAIFKNGDQQVNLRSDQDVAAQAKYQAGSITGLISLAAGDVVSVRFGSDANNQTFTLKHANLTLVRIG